MTDATLTSTAYLTSTVYAVPETVPEVAPSPHATVRLFITRVADAFVNTNAAYIGRVVDAVGAFSGDGYILSTEEGQAIRVYGQPVNPEPVNGKVYRLLGPEGLGHLVRYHDDQHVAERNHVGHPYSILAGPNGAWAYPNDSASPAAIEASHLIEVEYEVSDVRQSDAEEAPAAAETPTVTADVFKGLAVDDGDGVVVNPEPVEGVTYIVGYPVDNVDRYQIATFAAGTLAGRGTFSIGDDGTIEQVSRYGDRWTMSSEPNITWAAMKMLAPEPAPDVTRTAIIETLTSQYNSLVSSFDAFNEALNEKADDSDWCGEYEGIIEPLGMTGRNKKKDWIVEVIADVTVTDSSPSSRMDNSLRSEWAEESFTSSNMEVTGTVTVNIDVDETSEDEAREYVDSDTIESRLEDMFRGCSVELTDWRIEDVTERD